MMFAIADFIKRVTSGAKYKETAKIIVKRDDEEWTLRPSEFERFEFIAGDVCTVVPEPGQPPLPTIWGDTIVQTAPGKSVRVPAIYYFHDYKGFHIPTHLIFLTGAGPESFEEVAVAHIERFKKHVGIEPNMQVLELGCGIGRDAYQLLDFFDKDGGYIGVDVTRDSIDWCNANIGQRYKNFKFLHFDAENELYNPLGTKTSMDFSIPIGSSSIDRIFLTSVFTHLYENEILHYLKEFRRILKPDGLVYATFFLKTPEAIAAASTRGTTSWIGTFDIPIGDGVFANDPDYPRGAVALTDEAAQRLVREAGLTLNGPYLKGSWSGVYDEPDDGQDVMILRR